VKIKMVHRFCGREVLVQQVLDNQGHCPWDGRPFNKDYTAVLAEAFETAEAAGGVLENALEKIVGMEPDVTLAEESLVGPIRDHIRRLNQGPRPGRR
jgi:hypothetical protein